MNPELIRSIAKSAGPIFRPTDDWCWRARRCLDRGLAWLRSCAICGDLRPPIDLLCRDCESRLQPFVNHGSAIQQPGYPFPVYALLNWTPENDLQVRGILHAFKRGRAVRFAETWAERLSQERAKTVTSSFRFAYPPASRPGERDHAWLLGQAYARLWAAPVPVLLRRGSVKPVMAQKHLHRSERAERRFTPVDIEKFSSPGDVWVFVDDVITTGSTAMAAYMALGDPDHFEVWALACRPKLAGKSGF